MALNATILAELIATKLTAEGFEVTDSHIKDKVLGAIAQAVIEHITTAGLVTTTITITPTTNIITSPTGPCVGVITGVGNIS